MIRLQDIADMAGVSRTTVSNVINGNTKRVSQATIDKITAKNHSNTERTELCAAYGFSDAVRSWFKDHWRCSGI